MADTVVYNGKTSNSVQEDSKRPFHEACFRFNRKCYDWKAKFYNLVSTLLALSVSIRSGSLQVFRKSAFIMMLVNCTVSVSVFW